MNRKSIKYLIRKYKISLITTAKFTLKETRILKFFKKIREESILFHLPLNGYDNASYYLNKEGEVLFKIDLRHNTIEISYIRILHMFKVDREEFLCIFFHFVIDRMGIEYDTLIITTCETQYWNYISDEYRKTLTTKN